MSEYTEWCKNIHSGGLSKCPFCCKEIPTSALNFRYVHYQNCQLAKRFYKEIFSLKMK